MVLVASGAGARLGQPPVQSIALRELGIDVFMAVEALCRLVCLEGVMAKTALRFEFSVGVKTSQLDPNCLFCADLARVKYQAASKP